MYHLKNRNRVALVLLIKSITGIQFKKSWLEYVGLIFETQNYIF